jgi:hypothetical protein
MISAIYSLGSNRRIRLSFDARGWHPSPGGIDLLIVFWSGGRIGPACPSPRD